MKKVKFKTLFKEEMRNLLCDENVIAKIFSCYLKISSYQRTHLSNLILIFLSLGKTISTSIFETREVYDRVTAPDGPARVRILNFVIQSNI